jgi:NADH-quinone oxidoreductase subunit J
MEIILFWIFAVISVIGSVLVIAQKKALYSALSLIVVLCCFAGLFFLLGSPFVAAVQVIVYAGAIMILFIFIIWLLGLKTGEEPVLKVKWVYLAVAFSLIVGIEILYGFITYFKSTKVVQTGNIQELAKVLLGKYVLPFELTSILFLAALVGAFYLAKGKGKV